MEDYNIGKNSTVLNEFSSALRSHSRDQTVYTSCIKWKPNVVGATYNYFRIGDRFNFANYLWMLNFFSENLSWPSQCTKWENTSRDPHQTTVRALIDFVYDKMELQSTIKWEDRLQKENMNLSKEDYHFQYCFSVADTFPARMAKPTDPILWKTLYQPKYGGHVLKYLPIHRMCDGLIVSMGCGFFGSRNDSACYYTCKPKYLSGEKTIGDGLFASHGEIVSQYDQFEDWETFKFQKIRGWNERLMKPFSKLGIVSKPYRGRGNQGLLRHIKIIKIVANLHNFDVILNNPYENQWIKKTKSECLQYIRRREKRRDRDQMTDE